ncbi:hypothetical protein [Saccharothrix saharensis]|uniref:hypothetical protein n=1 Tax=Saccharothrix saharensis TaxID=571190 RepID=UPI001152563A|nr:hypothetical protein [Saccharothrix saharensis]
MAEILEALFDRHRKPVPAGSKRLGRPYSNQEVADWCTARGVEMSQTHVWNLRQVSKAVDPRVSHLKAIAEFFGYRPAYFLDADVYWDTEAQLGTLPKSGEGDLAIPTQEAQARVLMRRVDGLTQAGLALIAGVVDQVAEWEKNQNHVRDTPQS